MSIVFLNGRFIDQKRAVVSTLDRGLLYGDGLFETMRAYGGRVFRIRAHVARLLRSARALRIPLKMSAADIEEAVSKLLQLNVAQPPSAGRKGAQAGAPVPHQRKSDAYVRVTLTRGPHTGDLALDTGERPTLVIHARAFHGYPGTLYLRGMKVALADAVRPTRSAVGRHKTLCYLENLLARDAAKNRGFDETLFLDDRGFVAECSASNIFFVRRSALFTPSTEMNILPGVTRAVVIELARAAGVRVTEGKWRLATLQRADEVFLTNSLMEVMPVSELAGTKIGGRAPGPATGSLAAAYRRLVEKECGIA